VARWKRVSEESSIKINGKQRKLLQNDAVGKEWNHNGLKERKIANREINRSTKWKIFSSDWGALRCH